MMSKYFHISKANPIRFAKRVDFSTTYKNDENTLSCEVDVRLPYQEVQLWQTNDIIQNQFKSGYANNQVFIVKSDLTEVTIPIIKKSENFGIQVKMDAKIKASGNKTFIYFLSGNIYVPGTTNILETYALGGELPVWAKFGNEIIYNGLTKSIENVFFDEITNADVIVINSIYTAIDTDIIVECTYDSENFEVFEFSVEMANYQDQKIRLKIISTDGLDVLENLSERIFVAEKHLDTINIKYKNSTNTDVNFGTGIEFELRQKASFINGISDESSEKYKTDTNVILLSSDIYEGDEFIFHPVTKEIMRKLISALSHDEVFINDVGYVKNETIEKEGPLGDTNLYHLKAKMLKNGLIYEKEIPPVFIPKVLEILTTSWINPPNGTGGKDLTINFQSNFAITALKYQFSVDGINWGLLLSSNTLTSPMILLGRGETSPYIRIADFDGNEITYSNSKQWYIAPAMPSIQLKWRDTQDGLVRNGNLQSLLVDAFNIVCPSGTNYDLNWQTKTGNNNWVQLIQSNIPFRNFSFVAGINQMRVLITDNVSGFTGTSNVLEYTKQALNPIVPSGATSCSGSNFGGQTAPSCGNSGTITVNSGTFDVKALASVYTGNNCGVSVTVTINGTTLSASNFSGQGQDHYSQNFVTIGVGTHSYSYTVTFSGNNGSAGGGLSY